MFKFRLKSIERLKEHQERNCQEALGLSLTQLKEAEAARLLLTNETDRVLTQYLEYHQGPVSIHKICLAQNYAIHLEEQLAQQQMKVRECQANVHEAQLALVQAMRDKKILYKLAEKQLQNYLREETRAEQGFLDEQATARRRYY